MCSRVFVIFLQHFHVEVNALCDWYAGDVALLPSVRSHDAWNLCAVVALACPDVIAVKRLTATEARISSLNTSPTDDEASRNIIILFSPFLCTQIKKPRRAPCVENRRHLDAINKNNNNNCCSFFVFYCFLYFLFPPPKIWIFSTFLFLFFQW